MFKHILTYKVNEKKKKSTRELALVSIQYVLTYAGIQREENNQIQKQNKYQIISSGSTNKP